MLYSSWSMVCIRSGSSQWFATSVVEVSRLRCLCSSWMRFFVHVRMMDCMLLPLSVIWVPKISRPWNCWVLPKENHSSSFKIKLLQQCDPTHLSAPINSFYNMICSSGLNVWTASCLLQLSVNSARSCTNVTNTAWSTCCMGIKQWVTAYGCVCWGLWQNVW